MTRSLLCYLERKRNQKKSLKGSSYRLNNQNFTRIAILLSALAVTKSNCMNCNPAPQSPNRVCWFFLQNTFQLIQLEVFGYESWKLGNRNSIICRDSGCLPFTPNYGNSKGGPFPFSQTETSQDARNFLKSSPKCPYWIFRTKNLRTIFFFLPVPGLSPSLCRMRGHSAPFQAYRENFSKWNMIHLPQNFQL